jgi:hypothetical protein
MSAQAAKPILMHQLDRRSFDFRAAFPWATAMSGKGRLRQSTELIALGLRRGFLPEEYYLLGLFRKDPAERRRWLSISESTALNATLGPRGPRSMHAVIDDKVLSSFIFDRAGLATPRILAHVSGRQKLRDPKSLMTEAEVLAFLRGPGALPCFGKPVHFSHAMGAVIFRGLSPDGAMLELGDGRRVPTAAVAAEILEQYSDGYVFQELLENAAPLAERIGPTAATIRMVTVLTEDGPKLLYAAMRMPGAGAMNDNSQAGRSTSGLIDAAVRHRPRQAPGDRRDPAGLRGPALARLCADRS